MCVCGGGGGGVPVYQASVMSEDSDRCVCVPVCGGGGWGVPVFQASVMSEDSDRCVSGGGRGCLPGLCDVRGF